MKKLILESDLAPKAIGPYSCGIEAGDLIFLSGQLPIDLEGNCVSDDVIEQTFQVLRNIETLLEERGLDFRYIVKTTVFLTNMDDFEAMNQIYGVHFSAPYPARSTIQVAALPKGAKVEIECIVNKCLHVEEADDASCPDHDCSTCKDGCCCG